MIAEAGVDLTPAEAWCSAGSTTAAIPAVALNAGDDQDRVRLAEGALRLRERGMVDGGDGLQLTNAGTGLRERCAARDRRLPRSSPTGSPRPRTSTHDRPAGRGAGAERVRLGSP